MLESLFDAFTIVQHELTNSVQKFRNATPSAVERSSSEAIASLLKTQAGSNLLLKYQLNIEMMEQMNDENIRLANLCSTRMGRVQQMCNERAEVVMACYNHLRTLDQIRKELVNLGNEINKLSRFCLQTELAMTNLEALLIIADTEADIAIMKSDITKPKAQTINVLQHSNNIADVGLSSLALNQDELRPHNQLNLEMNCSEEVALEEFLRCCENDD